MSVTDWGQAVDDLLVACRDTFGVPATYTTPTSDTHEFVGIFDDNHEMATTSAAGIPVSTRRAVIDVRLADLPVLPVENGEVVVNAVTYRVKSVHTDGQGSARLILQKKKT